MPENLSNQEEPSEAKKEALFRAHIQFLLDQWKKAGGESFTVLNSQNNIVCEVSAGSTAIDLLHIVDDDEKYREYLNNPNYLNIKLGSGVTLECDPQELQCKQIRVLLSPSDELASIVKDNLSGSYGVDVTNRSYVSSIHKHSSTQEAAELAQRFCIEKKGDSGINFTVSASTITDPLTNESEPTPFSQDQICGLLNALYLDKTNPSNQRFQAFFKSSINDWNVK